MPSAPPFPIRIDDLNVDFLSAALGRTVTAFTSERVGADRGMLGEIHRLDVRGESGSQILVAKFASLREGSLASALRGRNYERELRCYETLLADTPINAPECLGTWYDPDTAHFLLLQSWVAADTSADQVHGLSEERAHRVVSEMAALHARWWADESLPVLDWLPRLDGELRIDNLTTLARLGWPQLVDLLGDDLPAVPTGLGDELPERIEQALVKVASLPHTLLHCDLRADNLLFDPDDDAVTVVDWQGCGIGPAAFDLAYFIVQSLTVESRRALEASLIARWIDDLAAHGVVADDPTAGYTPSIWYGMAIACALPVISDPGEPRVRQLATAVVTRTIAALIDHGELPEPEDHR